MSDIDEWKVEFETDLNKCGEKLQQHECQAVCHKSGNENKCCFNFPHEIVVEQSSLDEKTNSLILKCLDGNVNYYNPYILAETLS